MTYSHNTNPFLKFQIYDCDDDKNGQISTNSVAQGLYMTSDE